MLVWLSKMVWHNILAPAAEIGKKTDETLTPAVDWLDALIGPRGLLLLISDLLQFQFQFYGWGQNKEIHNNFIKRNRLLLEVHILSMGGAGVRTALHQSITMPASLVLPVEWWSGADLTLFQLFCLTFYMLYSCRDLTDDSISHRVVRLKPSLHAIIVWAFWSLDLWLHRCLFFGRI